ncbi:cryptochrome/photolyase family protein [Candidatus Bipolaricaulota bacterium]|nr:cryptochrome/photolyase family protein [Candidatus Bipolaricaulota bacterium]
MTGASLVLPPQLFEKGPPGPSDNPVYIAEAERYFEDFEFHQQKILFHRASMKSYAGKLSEKGREVKYVSQEDEDPLETIFEALSPRERSVLFYYDPIDHKLRKKLRNLSEEFDVELERKDNPGFITSTARFKNLFGERDYKMTRFYRDQRRRLDVLIDNGEPEGGKWSFDTENRESLPESLEIPSLPDPGNRDLASQVQYVKNNFPDNPGSLDDFIYPVTRDCALEWFRDFLENRFRYFGDYQDAISSEESFLFHSLISPLMNTGLLEPKEVVEKAVEAFRNQPEIDLNSVEGFVRQIIGWREYVRLIYERESKAQKENNFWNNKMPIPDAFYEANTGIPPVDRSIRRIKRYGYIHHIERLMVIGNFLLLCEIDPEDVFRWFMELSIDSYDWVMTPNVYGMSQYADGGLIMTKPYISSSNYVRKMSDYPPGNWCDVWDGLFWRFIYKHKGKIQDIPRMAVMVANLERMGEETVTEHINNAEDFLEDIF